MEDYYTPGKEANNKLEKAEFKHYLCLFGWLYTTLKS